jgi:hypothetical protein
MAEVGRRLDFSCVRRHAELACIWRRAIGHLRIPKPISLRNIHRFANPIKIAGLTPADWVARNPISTRKE